MLWSTRYHLITGKDRNSHRRRHIISTASERAIPIVCDGLTDSNAPSHLMLSFHHPQKYTRIVRRAIQRQVWYTLANAKKRFCFHFIRIRYTTADPPAIQIRHFLATTCIVRRAFQQDARIITDIFHLYMPTHIEV